MLKLQKACFTLKFNYPEFPGRGTYVRGNLWTPVRDILVFENANQPFQEEKFC